MKYIFISSLYLDSQLAHCLGVFPWGTFHMIISGASGGISGGGSIMGFNGTIKLTKIALFLGSKYFYR